MFVNQMRSIAIELEGRKYLWTGRAWTDERFLRPPARVRAQLMRRLVETLRRLPDAQLDRALVIDAARSCLQAGHLDDAESLARRVLRAAPRCLEAAIVLARALRGQGKAEEAVAVTTPFQRRRSSELLTVRAAALCDLERWREAEKTIRRALAIDKKDAGDETLEVMARVLSARAQRSAA